MNGKTVYNTLLENISAVESQRDKYQRSARKIESTIHGAELSREKAFVDLAKFYLPDMTAESVRKTVSNLRNETQNILRTKQQHRARVDESLLATQKERQQLEELLGTATKNLNVIADNRDKLFVAVDEALGQDETYKSTVTQLEQSVATMEQTHRRLSAAIKERDDKVPEYEDNKLFMYLHDRGFGTDNPRGNKFTKAIDKLLAKHVDYKTQVQHYKHLKELPTLIEEDHAVIVGTVKDLKEKVSDQEQAYSDSLGLTAVIAQGEFVTEERDGLLERIEQNQNRYRNLLAEQENLQSEVGQYHKQAIGRMSDYFTNQSRELLAEMARKTPSEEDDKLVAQIQGFDENIAQEQERYKKKNKELRKVNKQLEGLYEIRDTFTRNDWEASRSRFRSGGVDGWLEGFLLGRLSASDVIREMDSDQYFKPKPRPTYSSSSSYRSSSRSSSSWGGGGFSSGGGFGGGGFSSGGGF